MSSYIKDLEIKIPPRLGADNNQIIVDREYFRASVGSINYSIPNRIVRRVLGKCIIYIFDVIRNKPEHLLGTFFKA